VIRGPDFLSTTDVVVETEVDGRRLRLTNLDKILWPRSGTSKRDMLNYYAAVSSVLLPHIAGRPLTLARYPEGVEGPNWFQTTCPHPPEWLATHPVGRPGRSGITRSYCVVGDLAGLLWVVNLASIELHPLLSSSQRPAEPMAMIFDLDPGPRASIAACCRVASELRSMLSTMGLRSLAKTSGSLGLHVYVPLNTGPSYADTKRFARDIARRLAGQLPAMVVDRMETHRRTEKVFVDWSQNDASKSTVAPYSLRAMPWPLVSTPLDWEEVEGGVDDPASLAFNAGDVLRRVAACGDRLRPLLDTRQELPDSP
jgi:bifunctional non-homologous end joining protein LigD